MSISLLTPHPYKPSSFLYPSNNAPSRLPPPHQTHPGVNPIHPDTFSPQQPLRENATFFMLTTNSETDIRGAVQSVSELEHRFNHKYNYPWIFLNDQPFSDEFKSYVLVCLSLLTLSPDRSVRKPPLGSHLGTRPLCADPGSRLESASMAQRDQGDRANGVDGRHPESWKYIVRPSSLPSPRPSTHHHHWLFRYHNMCRWNSGVRSTLLSLARRPTCTDESA